MDSFLFPGKVGNSIWGSKKFQEVQFKRWLPILAIESIAFCLRKALRAGDPK